MNYYRSNQASAILLLNVRISKSVFQIYKPFYLVQRGALVDREIFPQNLVLCGLYLVFREPELDSNPQLSTHPAQTQIQPKTQNRNLLGGKLETFRR